MFRFKNINILITEVNALRGPIWSEIRLMHANYNSKKSIPDSFIFSSDETPVQVPRSYSGPVALSKLLSDSIAEVLTDLVGTRAREAIYDSMEREHSTARTEIPEHPNEFFSLLENIFGAASEKVVERTIAKKIYSKLNWEFHAVPHFELRDYLDGIKTRLMSVVLESAKPSTR